MEVERLSHFGSKLGALAVNALELYALRADTPHLLPWFTSAECRAAPSTLLYRQLIPKKHLHFKLSTCASREPTLQKRIYG